MVEMEKVSVKGLALEKVETSEMLFAVVQVVPGSGEVTGGLTCCQPSVELSWEEANLERQ